MDCDGTDGGCESCNKSGFVLLDICPRTIEAEYREIIEAVSLMEYGILPMAGGLTDQKASFIEISGFVRNDLTEWRQWQRRRQQRK